MSYSPALYVATAGQREFDVPFPFINRSHVEVLVNGVITPIQEWVGGARLRIATPLAGGESVVLQRETPIDQALVKFQNGAVLTQEDLNLAVQQLLYRQQEVTALYNGSLKAAQVRIASNLGIVTTPEGVAQQIAEMVLEQQVLDTFRQAIADIDLNAQAIIDQALGLQETGGALATLRQEHDLLVETVDALLGGDPGTGIATLIQQESTERIAGDTALAQTLALIGAKSGDNLAFVFNLNTARVSPTETLAQRFSALSATDAANSAAITAEQTARITQDAALASSISALDVRLDNAEAAITSEETARISGDTALASSISTLGVRVDDNAAAIVTERNARIAGDQAEAQARQSLATQVNNNSAAIQTESTVRANADAVFAQNFALLGARTGNGQGWVLDLNKVQVDGSTSLATRLSGIDVALGNNAAAIVNEATARANADSALSQQISVVSSQVGPLQASVSTLAQSVNGIAARYGVSLDVNGYVTGFVQNNNGSSGSFDILADRFRVVIPGQAPRTVFEINGTDISMTGSVRVNGNLLVGGTVQTVAIQQNAVSTSAYWQTAFGGAMSSFPQNVWVDFSTATSGGGGGGGGGSGGGGGGFQVNLQ